MNLNDLKNLDIKNIDLKNIDLKNIDVNKIKSFIEEKKQIVAAVAIGVVAVFILFSMVNGYQAKMAELKNSLLDLGGKADVIKEYEETLKQSQEFLQTLPADIDEDQISNEISDYAAKNNIVIASYAQVEKRTEGLTLKTSILVSFAFEKYADLLGFIRTLEHSSHAFKIASCSLTSKGEQDKDKKGIEPEIDATIMIIYTEIKK